MDHSILNAKDPVQRGLFYALLGGLPMGAMSYIATAGNKKKTLRNALLAGMTSGFGGYFLPELSDMYKSTKPELEKTYKVLKPKVKKLYKKTKKKIKKVWDK